MLDQVANGSSAGPVHGSHVIDGWSGVDDVLAARGDVPAIVSERISEPASEAVTEVVELAGAASGDAEAALDAVASELAAAAGPPIPEEIVDLPVTESADAALEGALAALEALPVSETTSVHSRSIDTPRVQASVIDTPHVEVSSPAIDTSAKHRDTRNSRPGVRRCRGSRRRQPRRARACRGAPILDAKAASDDAQKTRPASGGTSRRPRAAAAQG